MNSISIKLSRGKGPLWRALRQLRLRLLTCHMPVPAAAKPALALCYRLHVAVREATAWAVRFFWCEPIFRSQCSVVGHGFRMERLPYIAGRGRITIGRSVRLSGKSHIGFSGGLGGSPALSIGDGTFVGHDCRFAVADSITIGRHCLLAGGVSVRDYDGHPTDALRRRENQPTPPEGIRAVIVGDDVWIGAGAMILKGVTIGDRAIVGAGAVVTRDVAADAIVAGNPARVVGEKGARVAA